MFRSTKMPQVLKRKMDRGFAHPILMVTGALVLLLVVFFSYKSYKEQPLEDATSYTGGMVAGVSAPTDQIAAIPKADCDLFVATNGNDSNSGASETSALRNLQTAADRLQAGQVLCIKGGIYRQVVSFRNKNAAANNPTKIGGYTGGGLPIVDGGITNSDEYMLPDPQCKVKDVCGQNVSNA